jgi:3-methylfumaryl-CoA hydratase
VPPTEREAPSFDVVRELTPDALLLFRYSALTFNGHRIHYDRDYATDVEGYPERVVQGPLTATLLLDTMRRGLALDGVRSFEFRGRRPLFAGSPIALCARRDGPAVELCALDGRGALAMSARAQLGGPGT